MKRMKVQIKVKVLLRKELLFQMTKRNEYLKHLKNEML